MAKKKRAAKKALEDRQLTPEQLAEQNRVRTEAFESGYIPCQGCDCRIPSAKLETLKMVECPQCKAKKLPHRVCLACGYYRGVQVVEVS